MTEKPLGESEIANVKWNTELEQFEAIGPSGKIRFDGETWTKLKIEESDD